MRAWIDIDNPPQVQYLAPFRDAFARRGVDVVVTARDYGFAYELLGERGIPFEPVGTTFGDARWRKLTGTWRRTGELIAVLSRSGPPDFVLCSSRPAALAARRLRIPAFIVSDYEYSHQLLYGLTGATILHPEAIDPQVLVRRGLRRKQLVAFRGLKEDVSFSEFDLGAVEAHRFSGLDDRLVRVLFRPPAEQSHYFRPASLDLALATLDELARRPDVVVIYSPRTPDQAAYVRERIFAHTPIVLDAPVPFVSLLKSVDAVISSGGTMLREAAYLGIPAVSIFCSEIGAVDRYLESLGRLRILQSEAELSQLELQKARRLPVMRTNPDAVRDIVEFVLGRVR